MRILFIHEVGYLSKPIFEMHEFPELLAMDGNEVFFLDFEEKGYLRSPLPRRIRGRVYKNARLTLQHSNFLGGGIVSRIFTAIFAPAALLLSLVISRPHVVVTYAVPTLGWQASTIFSFLGIPVVFRSLDVSHQLRVGWYSKLIQAAEKALLLNVTAVSTHNHFLRQYLEEKLDASRLKVGVHLPPMITPSGERAKDGITREKLGYSENDVVVIFMGTFFEFSGVFQLTKRFLEMEGTDLRLILIGDGFLDHQVREALATCASQDRVKYVGFIPYKSMWEYLGVADIAVNPFEKFLVTEAALPNKLLQYLTAGLPVVSTDLAGARSIIGENNGVIWSRDMEDLIEKLVKLGKDRALRSDIATEGSKFVRNLFDSNIVKNSQVGEFERFLLEIASSSKR